MASTFRPNQSVKLTKTVVDHCPLPSSGQRFLRDAELKGFGLRVMASGAKSFIVEKRIDGHVKRITLARYGELTVEQARKQALKLLGQVAMGTNPIAERERTRMQAKTLGEAFEDFLKVRKNLSPRTIYEYRLFMKGPLADWDRRPLNRITRDLALQRHFALGARSESYANGTMRFLRSLFNFAIAQYEDGFGNPLLQLNPVHRITQTRAWFRSERRRTVIKVHQLPAWYRAVCALRSDSASAAETVADYLLLLLFTGLRRQEAAGLTWEHVDLQDRTLTIPAPKNHVPHVLPLSDFLVELLERRKCYAKNAYVFPGDGPLGRLIEPKRQIARVIARSEVTFTIHDLRRTFITIAEAIDTSPYTIKRLVNHKMRNDVTAGYIVTDIERLRRPMQNITDFILRKVELTPAAAAPRPRSLHSDQATQASHLGENLELI